MLSQVWSSATHGVEALPVEIETNVASGMRGLSVVGLPRAAVRESFDRVRAALENNGIPVEWGRTGRRAEGECRFRLADGRRMGGREY